MKKWKFCLFGYFIRTGYNQKRERILCFGLFLLSNVDMMFLSTATIYLYYDHILSSLVPFSISASYISMSCHDFHSTFLVLPNSFASSFSFALYIFFFYCGTICQISLHSCFFLFYWLIYYLLYCLFHFISRLTAYNTVKTIFEPVIIMLEACRSFWSELLRRVRPYSRLWYINLYNLDVNNRPPSPNTLCAVLNEPRCQGCVKFTWWYYF